jgi:8-amino-7-oxononanoate synthase
VFSTAAPPPLAAALDASLDIIEQEPARREQLATRVRRLRQRLVAAGVIRHADPTQIISIVIGDNDRAVAVAAAMQAEGFDVRAIRPPSVPEGTARLRVSVNAGLSDEVIDRFADALIGVLKEVGACSTESS